MDQVTGAEDLLGTAGGGAEGFRSADVTAQDERFLGGAGPGGLGDAVASPGIQHTFRRGLRVPSAASVLGGDFRTRRAPSQRTWSTVTPGRSRMDLREPDQDPPPFNPLNKGHFAPILSLNWPLQED